MSYIANKRNEANLTNVHWYDANLAAWSPNLLGRPLPYGLLPVAPANNDIVYFGIDTAMLDSGPFCSLVFDLSVAAVYGGAAAMAWEYWSSVGPGWVALTVQDNTNLDGYGLGNSVFSTTGVRSVHWVQPATWVVNDPGVGVTGYWVRCIATIGGGDSITTPIQQTNHPYTITWPFVEVDEDDAPLGDVTALMRMLIRNQSDRASTGVVAFSNRFVIGLRSLSRGADFTAYINFANEQNPANIAVTDAVFSNFVADVETPTGVKIAILAPVAGGNLVAGVSILTGLVQQYRGRFHCFLRGKQTSGVAQDISIGIVGHHGSGARFWESERVAFQNTNVWQILDMGTVYIPGQVAGSTSWVIEFLLRAYGNGASNAELYDMILIPVDEWAMDCIDAENRGGFTLNSRSAVYERGSADLHTYLDIDGRVVYPKGRTSLTKLYSTDQVAGVYVGITPADPILQANAGQRLWFFSTCYPSTGNPEQQAWFWVANTVRLSRCDRYLSMRGDR